MQKRQRLWLRWGLAVVLLAVVVAWLTRSSWFGVTVEVVEPTQGPLALTVVSSGRVMAPAELRLGSSIGGIVEQVGVKEGERVREGQVIVRLDGTEALATVARAEAVLASVSVRRKVLEAKLAPRAREGLRQARASLNQAERDAKRSRNLAKQRAATKVEVEQAETALKLEKSRYRQARLDVRDAGPEGSEVDAIDASEAEALASLELAKVRLALTKIVSPVDGVVLKRAVEPGEAAQPGATLITVAKDGPQRVVIEPDEKNLKQLALGQSAVVAADAYPEHRFPARVSWIAPRVDRLRGTIEVRLHVVKQQPLLKPDMTVSVEVELSREASALTLPREVVRDLASQAPWVLVVDGNRAARRDLDIGLRGEQAVQVRSGMTMEDLIIPPTSGGPADGDKIRLGGDRGH